MAEPRIRTVVQAPRFGRSKKRLPAAAQLQIDEAVKGLLADPLSGEPKTGALKGVRVDQVQSRAACNSSWPISSTHKRNMIEVLDVGPHENFYRELQKYLDAR